MVCPPPSNTDAPREAPQPSQVSVSLPLAEESQSIEIYQNLKQDTAEECCSDSLVETLCLLLAEDQPHRKILLPGYPYS